MAGALIALAIALAAALKGVDSPSMGAPPPESRRTFSYECRGGMLWRQCWVARTSLASSVEVATFPESMRRRPCRSEVVPPPFADLLPRWCEPRHADDDRRLHVFLAEAYGWPAPALWCWGEQWFEVDGGRLTAGDPVTTVHGIVRLAGRAKTAAGAEPLQGLPFLVIPQGLIVDAVLPAAVLVAVGEGVLFFLKRRATARENAGRCAACNHPVHRGSACPECGKQRAGFG